MKISLLVCVLALAAVTSVADDAVAPLAKTGPNTARPRQAPPAAPIAAPIAAPGGNAQPDTDIPKFVSEAKWGTAGYNNDEVYYTVFVTSQDARILRCTTQIQGTYVNNGERSSISDRQITTVFPNQPTQVGIWMDMDEGSGATYAVKCHAV